jgi:uncharacterized membrane protein
MQRFSAALATACALGTLSIQQKAFAVDTLDLTNGTQRNICIGIGLLNPFRTEGWYVIKPEESVVLQNAKYATVQVCNDADTMWNFNFNTIELCVHPKDAFEIYNPDEDFSCLESEGTMVKFAVLPNNGTFAKRLIE